MEKIKYIHKSSENEPFIVVYKAKGIPSAPLAENDESVVTLVKADFPEIMNVHGKKEIEGGLLHRLDTATDGLLLIAVNQEFYDDLIQQQKNGTFVKSYKSECDFVKDYCSKKDGFSEHKIKLNAENTVTSKFRYFGQNNSEVRPVTEESGKAALKKCIQKDYSTKIKITSENGKYFADCSIEEGFKHQVRCHLAWCGFPVSGDKVYNVEENLCGEEMKFSAYKIEFFNSITGKKMIFQI